MAQIGRIQTLRVLRETTPGLYLDGGELGDILLPGCYKPAGLAVGGEVEVFVYRDSEDRLVATTEKPKAQAGEFAFMKVVSFSDQLGAFLDWGLSKDLLLPKREMEGRVRAGDWVVAGVFVDPRTQRLVASTRLEAHLHLGEPAYGEWQPVRLLVAGQTPLGYRAIVENAHWGLLYYTDLPAALEVGQSLNGFVRRVRPDGRLDLALTRPGYQRVAPLTQEILAALKAGGGRIELDDKSEPGAIHAAFGTSKKAFKQALGALYRERRIRFASGGTELVGESAGKRE